MITGLLYTLAQKPLVSANDLDAPSQDKREGTSFPSHHTRKEKPRQSLITWARAFSLAFLLVGTVLLAVGATDWTFDPAGGLHIQTAGLRFTLNVGAPL